MALRNGSLQAEYLLKTLVCSVARTFEGGKLKPTLFAVLCFLVQTTAALADQKAVETYLVHGPDNDTGAIIWVFDTGSGVSLGSDLDFACMKSDLVFGADGTLSIAEASDIAADCREEIRSRSQLMSWELRTLQESGVVRLSIAQGDQACQFAIGMGTNAMRLTTSCGQVPGQPRQFRYFPVMSDE